jgi:hypothetical protein
VRADGRLRTIDVATEGTAGEVFEILGRLRQAGAPAHKVSSYRPSLDDVFLSVTGASVTGAARPGSAASPGSAAQHEAKEMAR